MSTSSSSLQFMPSTPKEWKNSFLNACEKGYLDEIRALTLQSYPFTTNIHVKKELGFRVACEMGRFSVVQFLTTSLELAAAGHTFVNIHAEGEEGFCLACHNGHTEIVRFLTTSPELTAAGHTFANILAKKSLGLTWASRNNHLEVVKCLLIRPERIASDSSPRHTQLDCNKSALLSFTLGQMDVLWFFMTHPEFKSQGYVLFSFSYYSDQDIANEIDYQADESDAFLIRKAQMLITLFEHQLLSPTPVIRRSAERFPRLFDYFKAKDEQNHYSEALLNDSEAGSLSHTISTPTLPSQRL